MKITIKILFCLIGFLIIDVCFKPVEAQQIWSYKLDLDTVTARLTHSYSQTNVDVVAITDKLLPDGSWPDINYADTVNASYCEHVARMKNMAIAYSNANNALFSSKKLLEKLKMAFGFFYNKKWVSANWWYATIGAPNDYMVALILLKNKIEKEDLLRFSTFLKDATDNRSHQGMNRVWVSTITIYKGCIEDDAALVQKGFASIASTLAIAKKQGAEGIKADNSFHQHHAQLYSGGYGLSFASQIANSMWLSANTIFASAFTKEEKEIYTNFVLNGTQLFGFFGAVDFGTVGRNISRPNDIRNIKIETLEKMAIVDTANAIAYNNWKEHIKGKPFPVSFIGNKFFWKSDIMVQHGLNYYLSAKVPSLRTVGTEMLNNENLLGYNLPLGATNIMTTGEEYNDIFPVWDWCRIPGTTAEQNPSTTKFSRYLTGTNSFAGGVSDSKEGVIAYEHAFNGVTAKKAYFFLDDVMVCLGAGINAAKNQEIVTSVNQSLANGTVAFMDGSSSGKLKGDNAVRSSESIQWAHHNNVGYLFPEGGRVTVQTKQQSGSWNNINALGGKSTILTKPVFSLWLSHGTTPVDGGYAYMVVPGKTLQQFEQFADHHGYVIVQNNKNIQAVQKGNKLALVFYDPGTVKLNNGLEISTNKKALVLLKALENGYSISIMDPLYQQDSIILQLNKHLSGANVTFSNGVSAIQINFPKDDDAGKTLTGYYKLVN